jgi:hypothetical protein
MIPFSINPSSRSIVPNDLTRRDVFISHASEDKDSIARPLAQHLTARGVSVWFDEYELVLGDSLRGKIADGLRHSRVGVVILSRSFFSRRWPQWELDGLTARQIAGESNVILPVWHDVDLDDVRSYSPPLADLLAARSSAGIESIADQIAQVLSKIAAGHEPRAALSAFVQRPSPHRSPSSGDSALHRTILPQAFTGRRSATAMTVFFTLTTVLVAVIVIDRSPGGRSSERTLRAGTITLAGGQSYDVDNDVINASDTDMYFPGPPPGDFSFGLGPGTGGTYATPRRRASNDTCRFALEHERSTTLDLTNKTFGFSFCLLTTERRIAVMTLVHKSTVTEQPEITLKYSLYE